MSAGWFADPVGRFPARWFDGTDWTDRVQQADGQVATDALERRSSGFAAPASPTAAPAAAPAGAWGQPPAPAGAGWGAPPVVDRGPGTIGLVVAGVGWLLVLLCMFALDWVERGTRSDISDGLPSSLPDGAELPDVLAHAYLTWAGLVLLVLVTIGLVIAAASVRGKDATSTRVAVALVAAVAAILHVEAVVRGLRDAAEFGAQVGTVGYLLVIAGLAIGSRTRPAT